MSGSKLVYLTGIDRRSGTNYLNKLLLLHSEFIKSNQPGEDWLLSASDDLKRFMQNVIKNWENIWKGMDKPKFQADLTSSISSGLMKYLGEPEDKYVLTKTPSTLGLNNFFDFFPNAKIIILIRDGRNLAESGVQSFGWDYEEAFKNWARSAKRILDFMELNKDKLGQIYLMKYEELYENPTDTLKKLFKHFKIDEKTFPYDSAEVPIVGSSTSSAVKGLVDWSKTVDKNSFEPNKRYETWSDKLKTAYATHCGEMAKQLGYESFIKLKKWYWFL